MNHQKLFDQKTSAQASSSQVLNTSKGSNSSSSPCLFQHLTSFAVKNVCQISNWTYHGCDLIHLPLICSCVPLREFGLKYLVGQCREEGDYKIILPELSLQNAELMQIPQLFFIYHVLHAQPSWLASTGLPPVSLYACHLTGEPKTGHSTSDVTSQVLKRGEE